MSTFMRITKNHLVIHYQIKGQVDFKSRWQELSLKVKQFKVKHYLMIKKVNRSDLYVYIRFKTKKTDFKTSNPFNLILLNAKSVRGISLEEMLTEIDESGWDRLESFGSRLLHSAFISGNVFDEEEEDEDFQQEQEQLFLEEEEEEEEVDEGVVEKIQKKVKLDTTSSYYYQRKIQELENERLNMTDRLFNFKNEVESLIRERDFLKRQYKISDFFANLHIYAQTWVQNNLTENEKSELFEKISNICDFVDDNESIILLAQKTLPSMNIEKDQGLHNDFRYSKSYQGIIAEKNGCFLGRSYIDLHIRMEIENLKRQPPHFNNQYIIIPCSVVNAELRELEMRLMVILQEGGGGQKEDKWYLIPVYNNQHYWLFVFNPNSLSYFILDSMKNENNNNNNNNYTDIPLFRVEQLFLKREKKLTKLTKVRVCNSEQKDGFNCGLYVIRNMNLLLNNETWHQKIHQKESVNIELPAEPITYKTRLQSHLKVLFCQHRSKFVMTQRRSLMKKQKQTENVFFPGDISIIID